MSLPVLRRAPDALAFASRLVFSFPDMSASLVDDRDVDGESMSDSAHCKSKREDLQRELSEQEDVLQLPSKRFSMVRQPAKECVGRLQMKE